MKIVQIGAGAVAESILAALEKVGNTPIALYNRSISRAQELKEKYASDLLITNDLKELPTDADCYLFSLKDDAIALVASAMPSTKGVWLQQQHAQVTYLLPTITTMGSSILLIRLRGHFLLSYKVRLFLLNTIILRRNRLY